MSLTNYPTILTPAFEYFAKYPKKEGMLNVFKRGTSPLPEYAEIKARLQTLDPHSLVPQITNYLFSVNDDALKKQVENINGTFLFLDYGGLNTNKDQLQRLNDTVEFGLIVAEKMKPEDSDSVEMIIRIEYMLVYIRKIREQMIADQKCSPFVKKLSFPHRIDPWYARDMSHATGWSMLFQQQGIDLI
jgi:hypothetical protein